MLIEIEINGPKIDENSILKLESFLKKKLPKEYSHFLLKYNGGEPVQRAIDFDTPISTGDYIATFYEISEDVTYGIQGNIEKYADLFPENMILIANSPSGNYFLLSLREDSYGEVFYKDHELEDKSIFNPKANLFPESIMKIATSFNLFLEKLYNPDEM